MIYKIDFALFIFICTPGISNAQFFDNLSQKGVDSLSKYKSEIWAGLSENSIISRLKEMLQVGIGKAADYSSRADCYLGNPQMKIPMPEKNN
jgi:hypothetical protein